MKQGMKIIALAAVIVVLVCMAVPVAAVAVPDVVQTGSITVAIRHQEELVPGGSLTLYRVGDLREVGGEYVFVLTEAMEASGAKLDDLQSEELARELAEYVKENSIQGTKQAINDNGKADFDALTTGLYLFIQEESAEGYLAADPFLVSLPLYEDGEYIYDVDASPKVTVEKVPEEPTEPSTEPSTEPTTSTTESTTPSATPGLPQTGQLNWPVPVLAAAGMLLVALGWVLSRGKEKNVNEK